MPAPLVQRHPVYRAVVVGPETVRDDEVAVSIRGVYVAISAA